MDTKSVIIGNLIYFLVILLLMRFMENRERFNPKPFMVFYNFVCVCLATYCFYGMVRYYFLQQPFLYCSNLDFASENAKTVAHVGSSFRFHRSSSTSSTSKSTGSSSIPSCSSYASRTAK